MVLRRSLLLGSALVTGAVCVLTAGDAAQVSTPPTTRDLLRDIAQATDADWATVMRGEAFAKVLATDNREVAVAGAVRIAASSERLVDRYREVENLKRSAIVLDLARLGTPPRPADFASVQFEDYSLDLRECRPGECRVRLGAPEIARFHREVDWGAADWRERSRTVWREVLAGYAAAYSRDGRRALPTYANKPEPLSVPAELSLLVERFGFVGAFAPAFLAYLREFGPGGALEGGGLDQVLYLEQRGLRGPAGPAFVPSDDLPHLGRVPGRSDRHQPDLCGPLSRRRPHAHDGDRRVRGRRQPGLLHALRQPRPHTLAQRDVPRARAIDGAEPQPRRAPQDSGVDEDQPGRTPCAEVGVTRAAFVITFPSRRPRWHDEHDENPRRHCLRA